MSAKILVVITGVVLLSFVGLALAAFKNPYPDPWDFYKTPRPKVWTHFSDEQLAMDHLSEWMAINLKIDSDLTESDIPRIIKTFNSGRKMTKEAKQAAKWIIKLSKVTPGCSGHPIKLVRLVSRGTYGASSGRDLNKMVNVLAHRAIKDCNPEQFEAEWKQQYGSLFGGNKQVSEELKSITADFIKSLERRYIDSRNQNLGFNEQYQTVNWEKILKKVIGADVKGVFNRDKDDHSLGYSRRLGSRGYFLYLHEPCKAFDKKMRDFFETFEAVANFVGPLDEKRLIAPKPDESFIARMSVEFQDDLHRFYLCRTIADARNHIDFTIQHILEQMYDRKEV